MSWTNWQPPLMGNAGIIGRAIRQEDLRTAPSPPPGASGIAQEFPEVPEEVGGGIGDREEMPSEEYMDIANNVALSKYYAHMFLENWPIYLGGSAVILYILFRR